MHAFLLSAAVIFAAELGDKSQLMALTFATRYRLVPVLVAIAVATALVHAVSVVVGAVLGATLPTRAITAASAVAFVGFASWTWRGDDLSADERARADRSSGRALVAVGSAFLLAELGDKTMLATITLATQEGVLGTWAGSTVGMVVADALAIVVGRQLGARLPERAVRVAAAVAFLVFAVVLAVEAARG